MAVDLEEFSGHYASAVRDLVHGILTKEFGFPASIAEQPDLLNIPSHYGNGLSNFWVARDGDVLVGTIGFVDLGTSKGLLRKMFVQPEQRGTGVARMLLDRVISWSMEHRFSDLYLGTNSRFHVAHRFYLKNGFLPVSVDALPDCVPRLNLRDQFFYRPLNETGY